MKTLEKPSMRSQSSGSVVVLLSIRKLGIRISISSAGNRRPVQGSCSGAYFSLWRIHALKCGSQVNAAEVTGGPSRVDWRTLQRG